jgi:hypothetical protein
MVDIQNTIEKFDTLLFRKVPYQVYLVGCFIMLLVVGGYVYEYNNQVEVPNLTVTLNDWVQTTSYCDSIKVQYGYEGEAICYEPPENPYIKQPLVRLNK